MALTDAGVPTSTQAVWQWESGETVPGLRRQVCLASVLGVDVTTLFALTADEPDGDVAVPVVEPPGPKPARPGGIDAGGDALRQR